MEANLTTDNIESYVVFLASGSGNVLFPTFFFTVFGPKTLPMWKKIYRAHWVYIKTAHFSISLLHLIVHQGFPSGSDYKYGPSGDSDMNWIWLTLLFLSFFCLSIYLTPSSLLTYWDNKHVVHLITSLVKQMSEKKCFFQKIHPLKGDYVNHWKSASSGTVSTGWALEPVKMLTIQIAK